MPESSRPVPLHMDRLCAALRVAMIRTSDLDYQAELRRQLVQLAVSQRVKQIQKNLAEADSRLVTVRKGDRVDTRPKPGPGAA